MPTSTRHGRQFDENIAILLDELVLAATWDRASLLLAVHKSKIGQEKAEKALEPLLKKQGLSVVRLMVNDRNPDAATMIRAAAADERTVYFISNIDWGGGEDARAAYRALNLHREAFVEDGIKAVFWLTSAEAANLAKYAPDFWAFRHRVVEFIAQRSPNRMQIPVGVLLWDTQKAVEPFNDQSAAIGAREELLRTLPDTPEALSSRIELHYGIGYLRWLGGDTRSAEEAFVSGLQMAEGYELPELRSKLFNGMGILGFERGDYKQADEAFLQALEDRSSSPSILINHAAACCMLGRNNEGLEAGQRAIRANPGNAEAWSRYGYLLAAMGRPDEAIQALLKAAELDSGSAKCQEALAIVYDSVGRPDEAQYRVDAAAEMADGVERLYVEVLREALQSEPEAALKSAAMEQLVKQRPAYEIRRDANLGMLFESQDLTDLQA